MSRNSNGVYNTPEPPFVGHTPIVAAPMNNNMIDIAQALTLSVATDGDSTVTGQIKVSYGSAGAPSYTFEDDIDTGFYYTSSDGDFIFVVGGSELVIISSDGSIDWQGEFIVNGDVDIRSIAYEEYDIGNLYVTTSVIFSSEVAIQSGDLSSSSAIFEDIHADDDISLTDGFIELSILTSASTSVASGAIRLYVEDDSLVFKNDADVVSYTDWLVIDNVVSTTTVGFLEVDLSKFVDGTFDEILIIFHSLQYNLTNINDFFYWFGDDIPFQLISYILYNDGFVETFSDLNTDFGAAISCSSGILPINFKIHLKRTSQNRVYFTLNVTFNSTITGEGDFVAYMYNAGLISSVPGTMGFVPSNENGGATFNIRRYNYSVYGRRIVNAP